MPSIFYTFVLVGSLLAAGSRAGPVVVTEVDTFPTLQERGFAPITLGNYSLVTSREKDVLFNIGASKNLSNGLSDSASLELECVDCRTWGSALITTTGVNKDESAIGNIISFFENPVDSIVNAFDLEVKIDFVDVGGHFDFELVASDTVSYTYTIFNSETPAGIAISSDVEIGLVLSIELVFSLTAQIDLEAGFEFAFPEGAFVTVDPLEGKIIDHGFTGGDANSLPILCTSGSATFKAALRINAQAGTTVSVFGTGFDFSLGVYADLIEYVATLNSTPICELEITELIDVNVGAFAHAVAEIDYHSLGVSPAVVTTLLDIPLPSLCVTRPHGSSLPAFATGTALSAVYSTTVSSLPSATATPSYPTTTSSTGGIFFQSSTASSTAAATSHSNSTLAIKTGSSNATSTSVPAASTYTLKTGSSNVTSTLLPATSTYALKTGSSNVTSTSVPAISTYVLKTSSSNTTSTIISAAALITSTVWTTDYITVTSCSSTVLHCPASAASEVILTSTSILYTTICPYGAVLPTTLPSYLNASQSTSVQVVLHTELISPLPLTPCTENAVSTIYVPTFVNPTYTMPTATSFPVAYPNWTTNLNLGTATAAAVEKVVATPSPVVNNVLNAASNGTVIGTAKTTPTSVSFTGAAGRQSIPYVWASLVGLGLLALL